MKDSEQSEEMELVRESRNKYLKHGVLIWLTLQNSIHVLIVRYSRARPVKEMFNASCAVFWTENVKLVICLMAVLAESGGLMNCVISLYETVIMQPYDTLKVCVPSFLYTVQNNLFYMAASHLDAATFMVTCQLKIFTTAIFAVLILKKSLGRHQWLALFLLFVGISLVQLEQNTKKKESQKEKPLLGLLCVTVASCLSGFSGIYFEKILKSAAPISVWMRNVQLAVCAVPISLLTALTKDGALIRDKGFLYGFDGVVWFTVFWYGIGGLSVAVVIKYADNIAKNFGTSVAIVISTVASMYIFDFQLSSLFVIGASLVIASIFLYSQPQKTEPNNSAATLDSFKVGSDQPRVQG